jgi:hypothetical protein
MTEIDEHTPNSKVYRNYAGQVCRSKIAATFATNMACQGHLFVILDACTSAELTRAGIIIGLCML